jgi:uncharacterized SAM-binding protein YcdF (DUF218 family)
MFLFKFFFKFLSFLLLLVLVIPLWAISHTWLTARSDASEVADAIVIMGAAQLDGKPGQVLTARLNEAKRIYQKDLAPRIYTLGTGAPGDRFTEADSAKSWLMGEGIRRSAIISLPKGRDSFTSIKAFSSSAKRSGVGSVIIVTDPYHCLRSMTMVRDQGFSAQCSPTKSGIASLENSGYRYLLRESGAYLAYISLGRRGIHLSDHVT